MRNRRIVTIAGAVTGLAMLTGSVAYGTGTATEGTSTEASTVEQSQEVRDATAAYYAEFLAKYDAAVAVATAKAAALQAALVEVAAAQAAADQAAAEAAAADQAVLEAAAALEAQPVEDPAPVDPALDVKDGCDGSGHRDGDRDGQRDGARNGFGGHRGGHGHHGGGR